MRPEDFGRGFGSGPTPKPPLGVMRRDLWEKTLVSQRRSDLLAAMRRYSQAGMAIPVEWVDELESLGGVA